jgi:hypothetical protein
MKNSTKEIKIIHSSVAKMLTNMIDVSVSSPLFFPILSSIVDGKMKIKNRTNLISHKVKVKKVLFISKEQREKPILFQRYFFNKKKTTKREKMMSRTRNRTKKKPNIFRISCIHVLIVT